MSEGRVQPLVLLPVFIRRASLVLFDASRAISYSVYFFKCVKKYLSILVTESQVNPFISLILNKKYLSGI